MVDNKNIIKDMLKQKAEVLKAISHPVRLCIVSKLVQEGSHNVTEIQDCLDAPQSTISQHLSKLRAAGVVAGKRNGTEVNYYVINEDAKNIINCIFDTNQQIKE